MNEIIATFEKNIGAYFEDHPTNRRMYRNISKKILALTQNTSIRIVHNKLLFTYDTWKSLDAHQYIKERRQEVHYLINHFIDEKIIHTKSDPFPKNLRLYSINRLPSYFLNTHLPYLDSTLDFKENITSILNNSPIKEMENYLYLYLYLFSEKSFTHFQLTNLNEKNHFSIKDRLYFVLPHNIDINAKELSYDIIDFDPYISKKIKHYMDSFEGENLFSHNYVFSQKRDLYIHFINVEIKKYNKKLGIKTITNAIKLNTQLTSSPFLSTISSWKIYPKQTLVELDRLYPDSVPEYFLSREIELQKNRTTSVTTEESDIFDNLEEDLDDEDQTFELIRTLTKIKTNPKSAYKKKALTFINKLQKVTISSVNKSEQKIATYLSNRLQSILDNKLEPQTFKSNLQTLNQYLFLPALYSKKLSNEMFIHIQQNIHDNGNLEAKTKAKYIQILNHFFTFAYNVKLDSIIANSYPHRSMIFDKELRLLVNTLIKEDKKEYYVENGKHLVYYKCHMRAVFLILLRYSALRKNELRSRRPSDWYKTDEGYAIDVNKEGFKQMIELTKEENKGLKNRAARRRVIFTIDDTNLKKIVDKFFKVCEKMKKKFVFLEIEDGIIHSRPILEKNINKLNDFIQSTLGRKVVLHSLRHSFITYSATKILVNNTVNTQKEIFELCNMTGQSDPTVMINNYLHIDHLRHFIQQYKGSQVKN